MSESSVDVRILSLSKSSASYSLDFHNTDLVGVMTITQSLAGSTSVGLSIASNDNGVSIASYETAFDARTYSQQALEYFTGDLDLADLISVHASPDHVDAFHGAVMDILLRGRQAMASQAVPTFRYLGSLTPKSKRLGSNQ